MKFKTLITLITFILGGFLMASAATAAPKVGDKAPDIHAQLSDGTTFILSEWLGRAPIVLYFYPKDDTPGCTTEACGLRDDIGAYRDLHAAVVGSSYDSVESHKKFIEKYKLPFPLIADTGKQVAKAYGVGGALYSSRATFIIGKDGKILYANTNVNARTHSQEIRDALAKIAGK